MEHENSGLNIISDHPSPTFIALGDDDNDSVGPMNSPPEINNFNFMLTNARSLAPKLDSFIENFNERNIDLSVVTETWLQDNHGLLQDGDVALSLGEGIGAIHRGRPPGMRGGGVGIFYRRSKMKVVDVTPAALRDEIVAALCSVRGVSRKVVCIGAYLTTALDIDGAASFLERINDLIHLVKSKYNDPVIIVAGDWNQAETDIAFSDFEGIQQVLSPPTRGVEVLDITFTNAPRSVPRGGSLSASCTELGPSRET